MVSTPDAEAENWNSMTSSNRMLRNRSLASFWSTRSTPNGSEPARRFSEVMDGMVDGVSHYISASVSWKNNEAPLSLHKSPSIAVLSAKGISMKRKEEVLGGLVCEKLVQRLELETNMTRTLAPACRFLLLFVLFLVINLIEHNPNDYAQTHSVIRSQFQLDSKLYEVNRVPELAVFLQDFAKKAEEMNPVDIYHWCAENDTELLPPEISDRIKCVSPQGTRLKFDDHYLSEEAAADRRLTSPADARKAARRMSSGCGAGLQSKGQGCSTGADDPSSYLGSGKEFHPWSAGIDNATKEEPPSLYYRHHPFPMGIAGVLPPLLWQTRFQPAACSSSFVQNFNQQTINALYRPPLNAPRKDPIIPCRSKQLATEPHFGFLPMRSEDEPRYAMFLASSLMETFKEYDWLDHLTSKVGMAMLLYTPALNNMVLLRVSFDFRNTGRIVGTFKLRTHTTIKDRPQTHAVWLGLHIAFLAVGLLHAVCTICTKPLPQQHRWFRLFDMCLPWAMLLFFAVNMLWREVFSTMRHDVSALLDSFYRVNDSSSAEQIQMISTQHFDILTKIMAHEDIEFWIFGVDYLLMILCFGRLLVFKSLHPRIAVLLDTVFNARVSICDFSIIFSMITILLAWLSCWSFGADEIRFSTFWYAIDTHMKMIMGEYPFEDPWKESTYKSIWVLMYVWLIFFLSANIFLAIIVDSFTNVSKIMKEELAVDKHIGVDFFILCHYYCKRKAHGWPSKHELLSCLRGQEGKRTITSSYLVELQLFECKELAKEFMDFYLWYLGTAILPKEGQKKLKKFMEEVHHIPSSQESVHPGSPESDDLQNAVSAGQFVKQARNAYLV